VCAPTAWKMCPNTESMWIGKKPAPSGSIDSIHTTISAAFGGSYVNDFIQGGRVKRVYIQADAPYRMLPKDLDRLYVRNDSGMMTPFASFATGHWFQGSPRLERFNSFPSLNIWGGPPPGKSSGEAMQAMEEIASQLPRGSVLTGPDCPTRSGWQRLKGLSCMPFPSS